MRKGKRRPQRAARRPGPNGDRAGTALRAGRTWRLAAPTAGLCAGAPPRRLLPPRLPHRRSPARGRLQTAGHGGARRGRGGPPEAGRAASGTRRVPSGERARAPQVKKVPAAQPLRPQAEGRHLAERRARAGRPSPRHAERPGCPAAPLPRGRRSAAARRRRRPPLSFAKDGPEVTAGTRPPPPAAPSPPRPPPPAARRGPAARPPAGTYLGSHAVPGAATPFPPLPSLPTAAGSFSACAPARQRRPSPLSRRGRGARRRQPIGCTARPGTARRGPRDRPARGCLGAGGRGSDAAGEASGARGCPQPGAPLRFNPRSVPSERLRRLTAAKGQYRGAVEPILTLESGPANDPLFTGSFSRALRKDARTSGCKMPSTLAALWQPC